MSYLKIRIQTRKTDDEGNNQRVVLSHLESDMADESLYELPVIMHYLSKGGPVVTNNGFTYNFDFALS